MHAPHHAPREWIDRYRRPLRRRLGGVADAHLRAPGRGRHRARRHDAARERPSWIPAWAELPADQRRLYARMMEAFAGFLAHTDAQIGRLLSLHRDASAPPTTRWSCCSPTTAPAPRAARSARSTSTASSTTASTSSTTRCARIDDLGGFRAYNHYAWGWAWAGNTPLRLWKRYTWLGGVRTPLIVRWPRRIAGGGEIRAQFCHAVDVHADDPRRRRHRRARRRRRHRPAADRRRLAAAGARRRRRRRRRGARSTSRCSAAGRSTTTAGRRRPITSARSSPSSASGCPAATTSTRITGRCSTSRNDFAEAHDVGAAASRAPAGADRAVVGRGRAQQRPAAARLVPRPRHRARAAAVGLRWQARAAPGGGPVSEDALPPLGGGFRLLAEVEVGARRRRRHLRARRLEQRLGVLPARRPAGDRLQHPRRALPLRRRRAARRRPPRDRRRVPLGAQRPHA